MATRITTGITVQIDFGLGVVVEGRRHRALRFPERRDRIDHDAEHRRGDRHADPQDQHVQAVDLAAQFRDADPQVEVGPGGHRGAGPEQQAEAGHERTLHHLHGQENSRNVDRRRPPPGRRQTRVPCLAQGASAGDSLVFPTSRSSRAARLRRSSSVRNRPTSQARPCDSIVSRLGCCAGCGPRSVTLAQCRGNTVRREPLGASRSITTSASETTITSRSDPLRMLARTAQASRPISIPANGRIGQSPWDAKKPARPKVTSGEAAHEQAGAARRQRAVRRELDAVLGGIPSAASIAVVTMGSGSVASLPNVAAGDAADNAQAPAVQEFFCSAGRDQAAAAERAVQQPVVARCDAVRSGSGSRQVRDDGQRRGRPSRRASVVEVGVEAGEIRVDLVADPADERGSGRSARSPRASAGRG